MPRIFSVFLCICVFMFLHNNAQAENVLKQRQNILAPLFDAPCERYGVPRPLALAIARQESGLHPWLLNISGKDVRPQTRDEALRLAQWALQNGRSFDVGIMQVNVYWIKKYRLPLDLVLNPQTNVQLGVWILSQEIKRHGLNWKAVAYYHTPLHKNPERGRAYAQAIMRHLKRILAEG